MVEKTPDQQLEALVFNALKSSGVELQPGHVHVNSNETHMGGKKILEKTHIRIEKATSKTMDALWRALDAQLPSKGDEQSKGFCSGNEITIFAMSHDMLELLNKVELEKVVKTQMAGPPKVG